MQTSFDLRQGAADLAKRLGPAKKPQPPQPNGPVLCEFDRDHMVIRVIWSTFAGSPYLSIQYWQRGAGGLLWPMKGCKPITVRLHELADFGRAIADAMDLAAGKADVAA